jgi:hypothetical protein
MAKSFLIGGAMAGDTKRILSDRLRDANSFAAGVLINLFIYRATLF